MNSFETHFIGVYTLFWQRRKLTISFKINVTRISHGLRNTHPTNRSCETVPLSLFVKHHFTARLLHHIFLRSLHQTKGAAPPFPYPIHLCCHLTVIHQWGHAQETRNHLQEQLQKTQKKIAVVFCFYLWWLNDCWFDNLPLYLHVWWYGTWCVC